MRRNLLIAALILVTVWAPGCIIVDAEKVESRGPIALQSAGLEVHQSQAAARATSVITPASGTTETLEVVGQ